MQWDCRLSTGLPPSSRLCWLWSQKEDLQRAWNRDRRAVWDQVGLSHCRHDGLVTVWDKARLRRGHNDQSCRGHQCSETTITGESCLHKYLPGDWTWVPHNGKQRVTHWTSETIGMYEWDCRLCTYLNFSSEAVLFHILPRVYPSSLLVCPY